MHRGYVRLWRKVEDSRFWSRGVNCIAMFCYLLQRANHKPSFYYGQEIPVGAVATSTRALAKALRIGHKAARIALAELVEDKIVNVTNWAHLRAHLGAHLGAHQYTLVTFVNWDTYNGNGASKGTPKGTPEGTPQDTPRAHLGHSLKNIRSKDSKNSRPEGSDFGFSEWYSQYPRREAKEKARASWLKLSDSDRAACLARASSLRTTFGDRERRFIPLPASYLNGRRWEDEVAAPTAPPARSLEEEARDEANRRAALAAFLQPQPAAPEVTDEW